MGSWLAGFNVVLTCENKWWYLNTALYLYIHLDPVFVHSDDLRKYVLLPKAISCGYEGIDLNYLNNKQ